ncbi:hypothetical protein PSPO01_16556 [Paraphaeosphaeria sporulosa]
MKQPRNLPVAIFEAAQFSTQILDPARMQAELHVLALRLARLVAELVEKDPGKVSIIFAGLQLIYQAAKAQSSVRQRLTNDHSARPVHEPALHELSKEKLARITLQAPAIVLDPFTIFNQDDLSVLTENIGKLLAYHETGVSLSDFRAKDATRIVDSINISSIKEYEDAARKHDPRLWSELTIIKPEIGNVNHRYGTISIFGQAHFGDQVSSDWKGGIKGSSHVYQNIVVGRGAQTRLGNKFGGTDFWDE